MKQHAGFPWVAFGGISTAALVLSMLPGTSDVNVWNSWVTQLNAHGLFAGYNTGAGHIVHPPLGLLLLWLSHDLPALVGVPPHSWPAPGFTGFGLSLWLSLVLSAILVIRISGSIWLGIVFQLCFLLNSVVLGYFDLWGVPFLLLAIHAFSRDKTGLGLMWILLASLVKWQYFILLPFVFLFVLRHPTPPGGRWARLCQIYVPAFCVLLVVFVFFGRGTALSFSRGLGSAVLSGQALNVSWLITWAMHLRWPESYGPLEDGLIAVIRTRDTRVVFFVRTLFGVAYGLALWRLWRTPPSLDNLLRYMVAGYLAFFLFNKGAHENHLIPAMVVVGYLAWRIPQWRWCAMLIALIVNVNMFAFYALDGTHRWETRLVYGVDYTLPLAMLCTVALTGVLVMLLRKNRRCLQHPLSATDDHCG